MNEAILFAFGCFVTLMVFGAVGLLMWGAANEPRPGARPSEQDPERAAQRAEALASPADRKSAAPVPQAGR